MSDDDLPDIEELVEMVEENGTVNIGINRFLVECPESNSFRVCTLSCRPHPDFEKLKTVCGGPLAGKEDGEIQSVENVNVDVRGECPYDPARFRRKD